MELNDFLTDVEISFLSTIFVNPNEWWIKSVESLHSINQQVIFLEHPSGLRFQYTRKINEGITK